VEQPSRSSYNTNRQAESSLACTPPSRSSLASLRGRGQDIGKRHRRSWRNMRKSASGGSVRSSAAETGAREMSGVVFEEDGRPE
jgi:hypothetical protein